MSLCCHISINPPIAVFKKPYRYTTITCFSLSVTHSVVSGDCAVAKDESGPRTRLEVWVRQNDVAVLAPSGGWQGKLLSVPAAVLVGWFPQWKGVAVTSYYVTLVLNTISITKVKDQASSTVLPQNLNWIIAIFVTPHGRPPGPSHPWCAVCRHLLPPSRTEGRTLEEIRKVFEGSLSRESPKSPSTAEEAADKNTKQDEKKIVKEVETA